MNDNLVPIFISFSNADPLTNTQLYYEVYSEPLSKFVVVVPTAATVRCRYCGSGLVAIENHNYFSRLT